MAKKFWIFHTVQFYLLEVIYCNKSLTQPIPYCLDFQSERFFTLNHHLTMLPSIISWLSEIPQQCFQNGPVLCHVYLQCWYTLIWLKRNKPSSIKLLIEFHYFEHISQTLIWKNILKQNLFGEVIKGLIMIAAWLASASLVASTNMKYSKWEKINSINQTYSAIVKHNCIFNIISVRKVKVVISL